MNMLEIEMNEPDENEEWAAHWCQDKEHDMVDAGDDDAPFFMCTNCGFSATGYVVDSFPKTW